MIDIHTGYKDVDSVKRAGTTITFKNGTRVSIQIGDGTYSTPSDEEGIWSTSQVAEDVEIAIIDKDEKWLTAEYMEAVGREYTDDVMARVSMEELVTILTWARCYDDLLNAFVVDQIEGAE